MQEKILLTPHDVAKMLGISVGKSYELFHKSNFPVLRLGKLLKISSESLNLWISKQTQTKGGAL